jgi:hypothetical protein
MGTSNQGFAMMIRSQRRRKGSGDLPGLQSRRFGSSRVEWWVRLPHASAKSFFHAVLTEEIDSNSVFDSNWLIFCPIL